MTVAKFMHQIYSAICRSMMALMGLAACTRSQEMWHYSQVTNAPPEFCSANLVSLCKERFSGIELQFMKGAFGTLGYLNVFSREVPSYEEPLSAIAIFEIDGCQFAFKVTKMEGSQKLLLPKQATELLIQTLREEKNLTIFLNGFIVAISGKHFSRFYTKMEKLKVDFA